MNTPTLYLIGAAALSLGGVLAAPVAAQSQSDVAKRLERMMAGESALQGKKLESAIRKAEESPLGSQANPVRVSMPAGQRAYLARLRCSDGQAPRFERHGNAGPGPFGNIVDIYAVECQGGTPASSTVFMDMYHRGFAESRAVPGFTVADERGGAPT